MKQKRNIWIYALLVLGFLLLSTVSCEEDSLADYASDITGTYTGTVNMVGLGTFSSTSTLSNGSGQTVNLKIVFLMSTESIPSFNGIKVSEGANGSVNLSGTYSGDTMTGRVSGNQLTWTMTGMVDGNNETLTFVGTK